jgi:Domain of unknown function (DUF4386)
MAKTSPQVYARVGGLLYLFIIVAGVLTEIFGIERLTVSGDATATANNILAHESLVRFSIVVHQVWLVCAVVIALILYVLLKPVSKHLALLAMIFNLVSIAIEGVATVNLLGVLFPIGGAAYLKVFESHQLHALAYLSLRMYNHGFGTALVFFACGLFLNGYLVFRSGYFPRTIGALLMIGALSYLANSFTLFLAPALANTVFPILVLGFIGEATFCLWLIVRGVDVPKWEAKAAAL